MARFDVKVINNPSFNIFRLKLESSDIKSFFTLKVVDALGRLVEVKQNLIAGQVTEIGSKYVQGSYFAEVTQGTQRKVLTLIKGGRQ